MPMKISTHFMPFILPISVYILLWIPRDSLGVFWGVGWAVCFPDPPQNFGQQYIKIENNTKYIDLLA